MKENAALKDWMRLAGSKICKEITKHEKVKTTQSFVYELQFFCLFFFILH